MASRPLPDDLSTDEYRPGKAGKRRRAREMALQMLYQQELGGSSLAQIFANFNLDDYAAETTSFKAKRKSEPQQLAAAFAYAQELVRGVLEHLAAIDTLIRHQAENWRLERMPAIDRNILRLALYEMYFHPAVAKVVIVDEAIELAKKFGAENSGRFVNGLLDGVLKAGGFATGMAPVGTPEGAP